MHLLRFMIPLLIPCVAIAQGETAPLVEIDMSITSSAAFQAQVEGAGGRVDFIFEEDRPFAQCHASSVSSDAKGDLLAVWFGGTKEKDPDVGIWYSRFHEDAWNAPALLAKVNETAHWNPVIFRALDEDTIYVFFKVGPEIPTWQTYWMQSDDHGVTWSEPVELVPGDAGGRGPVRCKPIVLSDGAWLAGASTELGRWIPFADRSEDKGKTWTRSDNFALDDPALLGRGAIQPTLWESSPGQVHSLLRSQGGKVWRSDSADYGKTWGPVRETALPNNNSGVDVVQLSGNRLLLVYNPVSRNWGSRTPIDLALSTDNGETWTPVAHLEDNPDPKSEFSYPAIVLTEDGVVITYTWNRQRVRAWQLPMALVDRFFEASDES